MAEKKEKQVGNAGRRMRWMAAGILAAGIAYSAGWYWLANRVEAETARYIATQRQQGTTIGCADRSVGGYPFRLEVFCTAFDLARPLDGLTVKAGAFRSAAQVYEPRRVYTELDSPVVVESAVAGALRLDWSLARATASLAQPLPERASVAVDDLDVTLDGIGKALAAAHAEAHMRLREGDLDIAWRYEGLVFDERVAGRANLPVLAGDGDVTIEDGAARAASGLRTLRGASGEIRRLALLVTPKQGLLVSGPFSVDEGGLVDATLELVVVDPAGLAQAFRAAFPELAAQIDALAAMSAESGPDGTPEIVLPVSIRDGQAVLGFIPLGRLPALM
ncbi:DUF2125 domain-containing protein [Oricola thermophila]|uniref:DUF2125 domain-containing protein n=1 Tax=Oricola thermophila TaxID=2742145 RepID=A0A6N1VGV2_9HYPH|nr:DUF2125 domain-containing protein [Oricola thermophila]QKV20131.1 DUF2125 domain-containing protein [Oricola thermophila]